MHAVRLSLTIALMASVGEMSCETSWASVCETKTPMLSASSFCVSAKPMHNSQSSASHQPAISQSSAMRAHLREREAHAHRLKQPSSSSHHLVII
eukprot:5556065-Prymnesium_polylepis.1